MKKVILFFANGTEEVEALTAVDLLRRAGAEVTVAGVGGPTVTGSHGIRITADTKAEDIVSFDFDMVVIPGGLPGTTHLDENAIVDKTLCEVHKNGGFLAAICAAPLVLGKRGYLENKEAICYPGFEGYLAGARISEKRVCIDGNVITGAGAGVATDFALALIEVLYDCEKSAEIRRAILAD
ncbi:MAG: DJ-1/PfpI family protein [Clostridia bacterium]|nr:DJ-1/PfpI family protein [Clostridia bacterium]